MPCDTIQGKSVNPLVKNKILIELLAVVFLIELYKMETLVPKELQDEYKCLYTNLSNIEKLLPEMEAEIEKTRLQIGENLRKTNVSSSELDKIIAQLQTDNSDLESCKTNLNYYLDSCEIDKINECIVSVNEKSNEIRQISKYDEFFQKLFTFYEKIKILKNCYFKENDFSKSLESIKTIKQLSTEISELKDEILAQCSSNSHLINDFDVVLNKVDLDVSNLNHRFIFQMIEMFKLNIFVENIDSSAVFHFRFLSNLSTEQYDDYVNGILNYSNEFETYFFELTESLNKNFLKNILNEFNYEVNSNEKQKEIILRPTNSKTNRLEILKLFVQDVVDIITLKQTVNGSADLIKFIGNIWSDSIINCMIDFYFDKMLSQIKTEDLSTFLNDGYNMENFLKSIGLLNCETEANKTQTYSESLSERFYSKICNKFIINMKEIVKCDLAESISSQKVIECLSIEKKNNFSLCKVSCFMLQTVKLFQVD